MATSQGNLYIPPPNTNTNRDSHIDLGLIGRGRSPLTQEFHAHSRNSPTTTTQRIAAGDTSAQDGASQPKETGISIGDQHSSGFPQAIRGEQEGSRVQHDIPWKIYQKGYDLKLDQFVTVATRKAPLHGKVAIKTFAGRDASRKLDMLHRVCHKRFVSLLEVFESDTTWYAVFEHVVTSLTQVVNSPAYPTERQLAAIVGQTLEGLTYLASEGLQHGSLTCSSVLLKPNGEIKIAGQECCGAPDRSNHNDVRAMGYITMELMQKYAKDDGAIGIENLNRWSMDSDAVKFLSMTTSARSVDELMKHALLKHPWRKEDLELMEELASVSVHRAYRYGA